MIALLTTKTTHHIYFENQIFEKYQNLITITETKLIKPKFRSNIFFEKKREIFEKKIWFNNKKHTFNSKQYIVKNINDKKVPSILKENKIKFIIVFGTRKISKKIISLYRNKIFNLHGGDPERFRGLDSHYWSIYHDNFNLYSCLHKLNSKLDDGDIVFLKKIKLRKKMKIYQLRLQNTSNCVNITMKLLNLIHKNKKVSFIKQKKIGRYYSFMPKEIKKIVEYKFNQKYG